MQELPESARVFWADAYGQTHTERVCESVKKPKYIVMCTSGHVLVDDEEGILIAQDVQRDDDDGWDNSRYRSYIPRKYITKVEYLEVSHGDK